jgi:hypothetical protein
MSSSEDARRQTLSKQVFVASGTQGKPSLTCLKEIALFVRAGSQN